MNSMLGLFTLDAEDCSPGANFRWNSSVVTWLQPQEIVELAKALPGWYLYISHRQTVSYVVTKISTVCMIWKADKAHCFFPVQLIHPPKDASVP